MLVLRRKINQTVKIHSSDGEITIRLVESDLGGARIGIKAPKNVFIERDDLRENQLSKKLRKYRYQRRQRLFKPQPVKA